MKPVVPITCTMRACAAYSVNLMVAAGLVKSRMPSTLVKRSKGLSVMVMPSGSRLLIGPISSPTRFEPSYSVAPAISVFSFSMAAIVSSLPILPPAPITANRILVISNPLIL